MSEIERKWLDVILRTSNIYSHKALDKRTSHSDKKRKRVMDYLALMEKYNKLCFINRGTRFERLYKNIFFYKKYVIKKDDIPESYFEGLIRNGTYDFLSEEDKKIKSQEVIKDQKKELDGWIDYFIYGNGRFYPMYVQFWVFQGLQKLGDFDSVSLKFGSRNKNTVNPVVSIDEAVLEMTISLMEKYISNGEFVPEIKSAFTSYNFKDLYEYCLGVMNKKRAYSFKEGIWKKYEKDSDYHILLNDIRGKYTGWCIERDSWAKEYLSKGDVYVFYSKDIYGRFTDPRITIRALDKTILEIRGIGYDQDIESDMTFVLEEKMKDFSFSEEYFLKKENAEKLSVINKKVSDGIDLDIEELKLLYEIDGPLETFGREKNDIIYKIKKQRNIRDDLAKIFGVSLDDVALCRDEIGDNTKVFYGTIEYYQNGEDITLVCDDDEFLVDRVYIPRYVVGSMTIKIPFKNSDLPEIVTENFDVFCPEKMESLNLPRVGIFLSVYGLTEALEIDIPGTTMYDIRFDSLKKVGQINFPEFLKGNVEFKSITHFDNVVFPSKVKGNVTLPILFDSNNLVFPSLVGGNFYVPNLLSEDGITFPKVVNGEITCYNIDVLKERGKVK